MAVTGRERRRRRPGLALALALLVAACGDSSPPSGSITVIQALAEGGLSAAGTRLVPSEVRTFRFTGRDALGHGIYGPRSVAKSAEVTLQDVPLQVVTLQIDYLAGQGASDGAPEVDADGAEVGTFRTSVDLSSGSAVVVDPALVDTRDPVERSYVTFGCNRVAQPDVAANSPSSANIAQLVQDFIEIAAAAGPPPRPSHLLFTGDLVANLEPGVETLTSQLRGWKALYRSTPLADSGVQLVAMAGNHELLMTVTDPIDPKKKTQIQNPLAGDVFVAEMAEFIPAADGPSLDGANPDQVERDESRLSFTFRDGDLLLVAVNTDTWIGETPADTAHVPLDWVREKIEEANADPAILNVLVFGHRPVDSPDPANQPITPSEALPFYEILAAPGPDGAPTKVRGYFAAHAHLWSQGVPTTAPAGSTLEQVISGNGGSPLASVFNTPAAFFGYSVIGITRANAVIIQGWGRPVPNPYDSHEPQPPATLREHSTLSPPTG